MARTSVILSEAKNLTAKCARAFVAGTLAFGMCFGVAATAATAQLAMPSVAYADDTQGTPETTDEPYGYTVRFYPGSQGSIKAGDDKTVFELVGLPYGTTFNLQRQVLLSNYIDLPDDSKYYLKGWKFAGKDDDVTTELGSMTVTSDIDLVADYGIKGEGVTYTVRYVDADGNELLPTESFYGNVGDSPVLAYRYVEGYLPQAYNLTGELYSDPSENVYTFTYSRLASPEDVTVITPTVVPAAGAGAGAGAAAGEAAEAVTPEDAPIIAVEEPAAEELIGEDGTPLAEPAEIEDIRDDETPMASANSLARGDAPSEGAEMLVAPSTIATVLGVAALVLIAVAIVLIVIYRKKNHQMVADAARASIEANFVTQPQPQPFYNGQQYTGQPVQYGSQYTVQPNQYVQPPDADQYGGRG